MKIWVIGRGYPTIYNGMRGSFEFDQAKLLSHHGYDVKYISLSLTFLRRKDHRGLNHFCEEGVDVFAYSQLFFPGSVMKKLNIHFGKYEEKCWHMLFSKVIKSSGLPDIIHIHYPTMICNINEVEKLRKKGVKVFVTEHWSNILTKGLKGYEIDRLKYYATKSKCFFSVSRLLQNSVKSLTNVSVPMEVVPNIVSPVFFNSKMDIKDNIFTFITISRLVSLKQIDIIVDQFISLFADNKKVKLVIVGTGPQKKKIEKRIADHANIIMTGELSPADVANELGKSNVLVSFSKYETFAVPVAEALACGKPVIVSFSSGIASFIDERVGIKVNSSNPSDLGKAMKSIVNNYESYDKESIARLAEENFSDEAIYSKIVSIYESK